MILAPLRGVTIRTFREVFAEVIAAAGFTEAVTPFIAANPGFDPLRDAELREFVDSSIRRFVDSGTVRCTVQFIGKDPGALKESLERIKAAGVETADLNCGCPFPMVRNKGRGSGILKTPAVLERMLAVGCETMGEGKFSIKARLGVERNDELASLMPIVNSFPLRCLTVHARNARQMYEGECDMAAFARVRDLARVPLVLNGDLAVDSPVPEGCVDIMVGRSFIRSLGEREDIAELLERYIEASRTELYGERPVLGRMKELIAYWKDSPRWRRKWNVVKIARSLDELKMAL